MYETFCLRKYYTDIKQLPVVSFFDIGNKNDLKYLLKPSFTKVDKYAMKAYDSINDQIIDAFGVNSDYLAIFNKKVQIEILYTEQLTSGRKTNQVHIEILEESIKVLEKAKKQTKTIYDSLINIEKTMGLKIDFKTFSVFDFFTYAKHLSKK